jgi:hypothetical protein
MLFVQCNQGNECDYNFLWSEWKSFGDVSYGNVCVEYVYFTTEVYYSNAPKTVVELVEVEPSSSSFSSSNFSFTALCIISVNVSSGNDLDTIFVNNTRLKSVCSSEMVSDILIHSNATSDRSRTISF